MPLEREFKLTGTLPDLSNVTEIAGFSLRFSHIEVQTNTYFDTPEFKLRAAGMTLRLRRLETGEGFYTWKGRSFVRDGWHQKQELEVDAGEATDLDQLRDEEILLELHRVALLYQLRPMYTFTTRRQVYQLIGVGELALDEVSIPDASGKVLDEFNELELEIKTDISAVHLEPIVAALNGFGMTPSTLSKSARALQAVGLAT